DGVMNVRGRRKSGVEFPAEAAIAKIAVGDKTMLSVALRDMTEHERRAWEQQLLIDAGAVLSATLDYEKTLASVAELAVKDFADWCLVDVKLDNELRRIKVASGDPTKHDICVAFEKLPLDRRGPHLVRAAMDTRRPVLVDQFGPTTVESFAQSGEHLRILRA